MSEFTLDPDYHGVMYHGKELNTDKIGELFYLDRKVARRLSFDWYPYEDWDSDMWMPDWPMIYLGHNLFMHIDTKKKVMVGTKLDHWDEWFSPVFDK